MRPGNPTNPAAPRVTRRGAHAPKKTGYVPFRPTAQLQVDLLRASKRLRLSVSEVVRRCCRAHLPRLEKEVAA